MYYKIGTLARRFGITTQALRFYEKQGLLLPAREGEGADRRYQSRNLKWLYSIRRYHDLGYSLEETLELFACESAGELDALARRKEAETRRELELLERRQEALRRQREDLGRIGRLFHGCEVVEMPRLWLLVDQEGQAVDLDPQLQDQVQEWMRFLPWVYAASVIERRLLRDPEAKGDRKSGFCVEETVAERLGMTRGEHTTAVGGCRAIHTVTALDCPGATTEGLLGHALRYAGEQGMEVGTAVGRCLAKTGEDRCREDLLPLSVYYEYWLPIVE